MNSIRIVISAAHVVMHDELDLVRNWPISVCVSELKSRELCITTQMMVQPSK
jgi:hypothetical protein